MATRNFLLLIFTTLFSINGFAQKKQKTGKWEKELLRNWKIVNIDVPNYSRDYAKLGLGDLATISLRENGLVWMSSKSELVIDSFFTFEKDGRKYIKLSALALEITKQTDEILELSISVPIGKIINAKILLIPEKDFPQLEPSFLVKSWEYTIADDHNVNDYYYDSYGYTNSKESHVIELKTDGSFLRLEDSILNQGKWKIKENVLTLNTAKGKTEVYYIRSAGSRNILLLPENKDVNSQISFRSSYETPERKFEKQLLMKLNKAKKEKEKTAQTDEKVESYYSPVIAEPPVEQIVEVPNVKYKTPEELLTDTFKATTYSSFITNQPVPAEGSATLILLKNKTYQLTYKNKTEKGSWKITPNRSVLIFVRNGVETYVPCNYQTNYNNKQRLKSLSVTLALPGEKDLKTINMVTPEEKK